MHKSWVQRLWERADRSGGADACWEYDKKARNGAGYGKLLVADRWHYTHRLAWQLINCAPVPDGFQVCHHCDNPPCINPAHLFIGTRADNLRDMSKKGRGRRGQLSSAQVLEIRQRLRARTATITNMAREYGVGRNMIWRASTGRSYKYVL